MSPRATLLLVAGVWLLMMAVRQDFWHRHDPRLVFGALPGKERFGAAAQVWAVSLATPPPSRATVDRFFPKGLS